MSTDQDRVRALTALAVLKGNWDERRDYVDNFMPLVAHCLRDAPGEAVSTAEVQQQILDSFGLRIPQGVLKTILGRAAGRGLVKRRHGVYHTVAAALEDKSLGAAREAVLRQHAHLVDGLREFAAQKGRAWEEGQAEEALLDYVDAIAEPILGSAVEGEPIVDLPPGSTRGGAVVGQYVLDLCRGDPKAFEYLETIVKGSMLANVLYFPDAFAGGRPRLGNIDVYLDTRVTLRALGYAEEHFCAPVRELVDLVRAEGAAVKIFAHNLREIEGVLDAAAATYRGGRTGDSPGDVVDFFASRSMTASDVELAVSSLEDRLAQADIVVEPAPTHTEALGLNETALEEALDRDVRYPRREPLLRDLDSLTAVFRLRNGEARRRLERCEAIFVTTNVPLVRTAKRYFDALLGQAGVPLAILDGRMAAMAWLMRPVQAPDLARKHLIANSYAALNPPDRMWRRYLGEIRKLAERDEITEEQVALLIFSPEARHELMVETGGEVEAFTEGTVAQVLGHAQRTARAEVEAELEAERVRRADAEKSVGAVESRAADQVTTLTARLDAHEARLSTVSQKLSRSLGWVLFAVVLAAVVIGTGLATSTLFPEDWSGAVPFGSVLVLLAIGLGLASLVTGFKLTTVVGWVERTTRSRIERRLRRWFLPSGGD